MPTNIFEPTANGYAGRARYFGVDEQIVLVAIDPGDAENAPDYRVHHGAEDGPEIGAGWNESGERAGDYVSLRIDEIEAWLVALGPLASSHAHRIMCGGHFQRSASR